jgi:arylsulfatase A-like enzyme
LYQAVDLFYSMSDFVVQYGYAVKRLASHLNKAAFAWLDENSSEPFFLFVNYFDPHVPYLPPPAFMSEHTRKITSEFVAQRAQPLGGSFVQAAGNVILAVNAGQKPLTEEERQGLIANYDDEIRYVDYCFGMLVEKLKALNVYDNTMIVVTSDHGEAFGEHNLADHGITLYEEVVHIPLIIKYPSAIAQQGSADERVSLVDIFPTVLALLNEPIGPEVDGIQLAEAAHRTRPILAEWHLKWTDPERFHRSLTSIYSGSDKYIWSSNGEHELYDLEADPKESVNLVTQLPQRAVQLEEIRTQWLGSFKPPDRSADKIELDTGAMEKLRALGYIQ